MMLGAEERGRGRKAHGKLTAVLVCYRTLKLELKEQMLTRRF
jgi:hypothetical protein